MSHIQVYNVQKRGTKKNRVLYKTRVYLLIKVSSRKYFKIYIFRYMKKKKKEYWVHLRIHCLLKKGTETIKQRLENLLKSRVVIIFIFGNVSITVLRYLRYFKRILFAFGQFYRYSFRSVLLSVMMQSLYSTYECIL